ncbi:ABC transporter permease, partial [Lysobacter lacus]
MRTKRFFGNLGLFILLVAAVVAWSMLPWFGVVGLAVLVALWLFTTRGGRLALA